MSGPPSIDDQIWAVGRASELFAKVLPQLVALGHIPKDEADRLIDGIDRGVDTLKWSRNNKPGLQKYWTEIVAATKEAGGGK